MNSRAKGKRKESAKLVSMQLVLPVPPRQLSPNARCHWRVVAKHKKAYKTTCLLLACDMVNKMIGGKPPRWKSATIRYSAHFKSRAWDDDNLIGAMKYARDAIADAGIVENDRGFTTLPVESFGYSKNPRIIVTIEGA